MKAERIEGREERTKERANGGGGGMKWANLKAISVAHKEQEAEKSVNVKQVKVLRKAEYSYV